MLRNGLGLKALIKNSIASGFVLSIFYLRRSWRSRAAAEHGREEMDVFDLRK